MVTWPSDAYAEPSLAEKLLLENPFAVRPVRVW